MTFSYKKWVLCFFISIIIYLFTYPFLVYYFYFPVTKEIIWINTLLTQKERIAKNIKGNKLVFGGGSATLFGVRTKNIQDELRITSVNMAVHAGLQIDYYLNRLKRSLNKGDIVVLPLEYAHFNYNGDLSPVSIDYIMRYDREYFKSLPPIVKIRYILAISPISFITSVCDNFLWLIYKKYFVIPDNINSNGDGTGNFGTDKVNRMLKFAKPITIQHNKIIGTTGLRAIKDFDIWCKNNNISCYVSYANALSFKEYNNYSYHNYFHELESYFYKNKIASIGNPYNFFYNKDLFYDTEYHLNQHGMTIRTKQLIKIMRDSGFFCKSMNNSLTNTRGSHSH